MTFWNFFFLLLIYVPLLLLWGAAILDVFRRDDLSGVRKVVWVFVVIVLPLLGTLVYLLSRPAGATAYERAAIEDANRHFVARYAPADHAQQLEVLASLHDRGKLTDAEFALEKQRVTAESVPLQAAPAGHARV